MSHQTNFTPLIVGVPAAIGLVTIAVLVGDYAIRWGVAKMLEAWL